MEEKWSKRLYLHECNRFQMFSILMFIWYDSLCWQTWPS